MSSVLSEYPETLPAPMVGVVNLTERRKISTIGTIRNTRNVQRDRHGTRTVAFVFTPAQAAIFREWWVEWEQRGGGWFAANWPLPWQRGSNVFRFIDPPAWQLIGGGIDGQGYWSVRATVEIRGRGMLPTVEVLYLTSTPYPVVSIDGLGIDSFADMRLGMPLQTDAAEITSYVDVEARDTYKIIEYSEAISIASNAVVAARTPLVSLAIAPEALQITSGVAVSAKVILITHAIAPEALQITSGVSINAN